MLKEDLTFNLEDKQTTTSEEATTIISDIKQTAYKELMRHAKGFEEDDSPLFSLNQIGEIKEEKVNKPLEVVKKICKLKYLKSCLIEMVPKYMTVEVEVCRKNAQKNCDDAKQCKTEYFTRCWSEMQFMKQIEDKPRCEDISENNVMVKKCEVFKKTVRRARPVSKCKRTPRKLCYRKSCIERETSPEEHCKMETKLIKEVRPKETCELKPETVCEATNELLKRR